MSSTPDSSAGPSIAAGSAAAFSTLPELLQYHARQRPDAPAILAPGRAPLSYGRLCRQVDEIGRRLRAVGIGRHDRVAVALPNGAEAAVAIVAVAAAAVCASLNPAYETAELDRYFADLRPRALLIAAGSQSAGRRAALDRGIPVLEMTVEPEAAAGLFGIAAQAGEAPAEDTADPGDTALLLLTSGTTSRAKIVPLTHANICASAAAACTALALGDADRCLNVLPLFHGHGLIATVLTSLSAGASVVCTPGCDVDRFFDWLGAFRPTWYSAVPTMHQAILAAARHRPAPAAPCRLRFVRSASAPLPSSVLTELERALGTCVIEFYGMTETASAPIACNPLPPGRRKPGSVGHPAGLQVRIVDDAGAVLPDGESGQVVVRGASVTRGYDGDPEANHTAFAEGWFKTGDRGFFDADGYLFLVGRSQEIINRGGENISPREIDEALLEHPAVAEAVAFAVPHPTLGEDVAAAVVLRPQQAATPEDIRRFVGGRLADFKVPRQVLIVGELPKSATGKVQRVGLAAKFGLGPDGALRQPYVAPRTPLEAALAEGWAQTLRVERVGTHDDFFALGGDSLSVTRAIAQIYDIAHVEIEVSRFFETPSIGAIAGHTEALLQAGPAAPPAAAIMPSPRGDRAPASIAQERLWRLQLLLPRAPFLNVLCALRLTSPVDPGLLERSLGEIVRRHEILRTSFAASDGRCVQLVAPQATVRLAVDDLRALRGSKKDGVGQKLIEEEVLHVFDLAQAPLLRARLLRLDEEQCLLLLTMHQIVADGWSLGVLTRELAALYEGFAAGEASPLPPLPLQYADFASWQRQWRSHADIEAQLQYWRRQLRPPLPAMTLAPAAAPRSIADLRTRRCELQLPARLSEAAREFGRREGGTLFMALVAAWQTLLHHYLGHADLRVATLVANRGRAGAEALIGPLANTVVIRTDLGGDPTARQVLHRVRSTTLAAFANQDLAFEDLVDALARDGAVDPAALAPVMLTLHNATLRPAARSGPTLVFEEANPGMLMPLVTTTSFDIILSLYESARGLAGTCIYRPRLFDSASIDRLLRDFRSVLRQIVTQPDRPISAIRVSPMENRRTAGDNPGR